MTKKSKRGFASLSPERRRELARKAGKAAHQSGKAHRFNHEEAVAAGRLGGLAAQAKGVAYRWDSRTGKLAVKKRKRKKPKAA